MPDQTFNFLFLAFKRMLVWFADMQQEKDFTDIIKGIILGLFEMYALCICVCVWMIYLYFLLALKQRGTVQLQILAHLEWMQPCCQDEVQPVTDHLCYMKWWECHHCQRPIFPHRRLLSKVSLATHVGLCITSELCMLEVNIFLKKGVLLRPSVKLGKHLQIHLLGSVTVQSSQKQFRLKGAPGDLCLSLLLKVASALGQTTLLRAGKAFLVQMNTKVLTVFSSCPATYFSPRKLIQLFLLKTIIFQEVPFPHCLVSFMRKKKKKRQDAQKSLTCEFLQNNQFLY